MTTETKSQQDLFNHLVEQHDLHLVESELREIILICQQMPFDDALNKKELVSEMLTETVARTKEQLKRISEKKVINCGDGKGISSESNISESQFVACDLLVENLRKAIKNDYLISNVLSAVNMFNNTMLAEINSKNILDDLKKLYKNLCERSQAYFEKTVKPKDNELKEVYKNRESGINEAIKWLRNFILKYDSNFSE